MAQLATKIWEPRNTLLGGQELTNNELQPHPQLKCRLDWVHHKCTHFFSSPSRKLRLLDVGSCYNPFKKFDSCYDITALDLCPAPGHEHHVHRCDFLSISIQGKNIHDDDHHVLSLPPNHFDIVVFSFFLEYLPHAGQRVESCKRAHSLLKPGGLLFILRPDSHSVTPTGNSILVKRLKVGAGFLHFKRIYFEKLQHLWCMGFVKLSQEQGEEYCKSARFIRDLKKVNQKMDIACSQQNLDSLFCIAQDFKEVEIVKNSGAGEDVELVPSPMRSIVNADVKQFQELPYFLDDES